MMRADTLRVHGVKVPATVMLAVVTECGWGMQRNAIIVADVVYVNTVMAQVNLNIKRL